MTDKVSYHLITMSLYIKLAALGALLLLSFLLNTVSVFTKGWLYWSLGTGLPGDSGSFGVVPYHVSSYQWKFQQNDAF